MFFKHVTRELSAYCHDELSAEESRRVAEHLLGCNRCRAEYDLIKLGVKLAQQLPQVAAPESLWTDLADRFDSPNVAKNEARRRVQPIFRRPVFAAIAAMLLLAVGLIVVAIYKRETGPSWEVNSLNGAPQ